MSSTLPWDDDEDRNPADVCFAAAKDAAGKAEAFMDADRMDAAQAQVMAAAIFMVGGTLSRQLASIEGVLMDLPANLG